MALSGDFVFLLFLPAGWAFGSAVARDGWKGWRAWALAATLAFLSPFLGGYLGLLWQIVWVEPGTVRDALVRGGTPDPSLLFLAFVTVKGVGYGAWAILRDGLLWLGIGMLLSCAGASAGGGVTGSAYGLGAAIACAAVYAATAAGDFFLSFLFPALSFA